MAISIDASLANIILSVTEAGPPVTITPDQVQVQQAQVTPDYIAEWLAKLRAEAEARRTRRPRPTVVPSPVETPVVKDPVPEEKPPVETPVVQEPVPEEKPPVVEPSKPVETSVVVPDPVVTPEEKPPVQEAPAAGAGLGKFAQIALGEHNKYRALHNAKALVWDEALAASAMKWATTNGCKMEHSTSSFRNGAGENLYALTGMSPSVDGTNADPTKGIAAWYNEWPAYAKNPGQFTVSCISFLPNLYMNLTISSPALATLLRSSGRPPPSSAAPCPSALPCLVSARTLVSSSATTRAPATTAASSTPRSSLLPAPKGLSSRHL